MGRVREVVKSQRKGSGDVKVEFQCTARKTERVFLIGRVD